MEPSRAITSAKVCRIIAAETSRCVEALGDPIGDRAFEVSWLRIVVIRNVASAGSRAHRLLRLLAHAANSGSFPASPTMRAVKPCAMAHFLTGRAADHTTAAVAGEGRAWRPQGALAEGR